MANEKIKIELTAEQQAQIEKVTGKKVSSLDLDPAAFQTLEERVAPRADASYWEREHRGRTKRSEDGSARARRSRDEGGEGRKPAAFILHSSPLFARLPLYPFSPVAGLPP